MKHTDPVFFVNAFANSYFQGNAAAVVRVDEYPQDSQMLALASEFGFSETAFVQRSGPAHYHIRWFTPEVEVALCGHATLASARALFDTEERGSTRIVFHSLSGKLTATLKDGLIELDFPAEIPAPCLVDESLLAALGAEAALETLSAKSSRNLILVYPERQQILELKPDFDRLAELTEFPWLGIAVTAPQTGGYICRYFAPWEGINEDPVTGSAQTYLAPYWSAKLGKKILQGYQASERGGGFEVEVLSGRVLIRGSAFLYLQGEIDSSWRFGGA